MKTSLLLLSSFLLFTLDLWRQSFLSLSLYFYFTTFFLLHLIFSHTREKEEYNTIQPNVLLFIPSSEFDYSTRRKSSLLQRKKFSTLTDPRYLPTLRKSYGTPQHLLPSINSLIIQIIFEVRIHYKFRIKMLKINLIPIFLLSFAIFSSNISSCQMMPSEQFFFRYLDDWISLINQTMETISPAADGSAPTNSVSNQCYGHMTYLMEAGRGRKPWALKSKFYPSSFFSFSRLASSNSCLREIWYKMIQLRNRCLENKFTPRVPLLSFYLPLILLQIFLI